MELLLLFFILLLVWRFMIMPFLKIYRAVNNARKAQQEFYRRATNQQKTQQPHPQPEKKKIDPTVGEYVQFTEVTSAEKHTDVDGSSSTQTTVESQVTDVTWEDI